MQVVYGLFCEYKGIHWFNDKAIVDKILGAYLGRYNPNAGNPCAVLSCPDDADLSKFGIVLRSNEFIDAIVEEIDNKNNKKPSNKSKRKNKTGPVVDWDDGGFYN